jgi:drug/metabolite transporter (DMT)-like permease
LVNILMYALYILIGQRWILPLPPAVATLWIACGAAVGTFLYALVTAQLAFDFAPIGWLWALLFGFASTAMAILFFWWGVGLIGPSRASIVSTLETPVAILGAVLILHEQVSAEQVAGAAAILAGVLLVRLQPGKPKQEAQ